MDVTPAHFLLDTNAVLYLLGGRTAQALPDGTYFLSVISELELLAYRRSRLVKTHRSTHFYRTSPLWS